MRERPGAEEEDELEVTFGLGDGRIVHDDHASAAAGRSAGGAQ